MMNKVALSLVSLLLGLVAAVYVQKYDILSAFRTQSDESSNQVLIDYDDEELLNSTSPRVQRLRALLTPRHLQYDNVTGIALPHQLLHLHHMKTGGTSTDMLLRCGVEHLKQTTPYNVIHECGYSRYLRCISGQDPQCVQRINTSAVISYCAPLSDLPIFGWKDADEIDKITTLRDPVDRVWSMYRFQTKSCYSCQSLKDVYAKIDDANQAVNMRTNCKNQLLNHMTRNMLASKTATSDLNETSAKLAIQHMETFVLGLTSRLDESVEGMKQVFPFLQECELQHANSSPKNNRCGPKGGHLELGDHPDEETRELIVKHNALDIELYEAALKQYELQMRILKEMKETGN